MPPVAAATTSLSNSPSTLAHLLFLMLPLMNHPPSTLFRLRTWSIPLLPLHIQNRPLSSAGVVPALAAPLVPSRPVTSRPQLTVRARSEEDWLLTIQRSVPYESEGRMSE